MNKLYATLVAIWLSVAATAQNYTPTATDYDNFPKTTTYVVLDNNMFSDFNMNIKSFMKNEWTATEYNFINLSKFEKLRQDPNNSFLMTTTVTYPEDKVPAKYTFFSLLMGKANVKINKMPDLISVPLCYANVDDSKHLYKLAAIIRFMLKHVAEMTADPSLISDTPLVRYNKNSESLKDKTLYLLADELESDIQTEAQIEKVYPYKFKLATQDEIKQAIDEKNDDVVFLHKVGPETTNSKTRCYKMLMGASDSQIYYFDYHTIKAGNPDRLRAKDLKKIGNL